MINTLYMRKSTNSSTFLDLVQHNFFEQRELKIEEVKNGVFLPRKKSPPKGPLHGIGGVVDDEGRYVDASACVACGSTKNRFYGKYPFDKSKVKRINDTVVYLGLFHRQWGHFLVDFVPRLYYFLSNKSSYNIVYTSDSGCISGNYLRLLQLIGVDLDKLILVTEPTQYEKIIIPEASYISGDYYTKEFVKIFDAIKDNVNIDCKSYEKIYLSRRRLKWNKRKEIGEQGIEDAFNKNGYTSLFMENLTLDEQIYYISHAKYIAAMSGTLCHNILFGSKDTNLIIINKTKKINEHQIIINQARNCESVYVDAYVEPYKRYPLSYGRGPFWVTNSTKEFRKFFSDYQMKYKIDSCFVNCANFFVYTCLCFLTSLKKFILSLKNK